MLRDRWLTWANPQTRACLVYSGLSDSFEEPRQTREGLVNEGDSGIQTPYCDLKTFLTLTWNTFLPASLLSSSGEEDHFCLRPLCLLFCPLKIVSSGS